MVCNRCIYTLEQRLMALNISFDKVALGEVWLPEALNDQQLNLVRRELDTLGFELLDDKRSVLVSQVRSIIIRSIHTDDGDGPMKKLSSVLQDELKVDYNYLSTLFSSVEGITIEKYAILQRIERAKELLTYNELSLMEIADKLHYSSIQHLSQQFKKVTGLTPSQYKNAAADIGRNPLDKVGQ